MWSHCAPVDAMMVVSEIGEQWSPATAPANVAATVMVSISLPVCIIGTTIGRRIPKVPQEVPVANARNTAIQNTIIGIKTCKTPVLFARTPATNTSAPRSPVIPDSVHANVRIMMAGTIALKPSGSASMN